MKPTEPMHRAGPLARLAAAALALALPAAPGRAALYEVTTVAGDNSAGSLGASLTAIQGTPGTTDTLLFNPFLSPTITPAAAYSLGATNVLSIDGNQSTTLNFTPGGLQVNGFLYLNGVIATGLSVNAGGTLSTTFSSVSGLTLNGPTAVFQTRDNAATSGLALNGGGTVDTFGSNPTFSAITGTGGLTVTDSSIGNGGVLTLNLSGGANTYSGGTQINSGTLQLGVNAALPAGSALNTAALGVFDLNGFTQSLGAVTNAGTIKTGFGQLTATSFAGAGTLSVGLKAGLTNLVVTGAAALGGPLVITGHPAVGAYTVVNAGTLSGAFTTTTLPFGVTDSLSYAGNSAIITILSDTPFTIPGQSANQASIGAALNNSLQNPNSSDLASVLTQMGSLTQAQQKAALDQIGPIDYGALTGLSHAAAGVQSAAVAQRLTGLQAGARSRDGARFASFASGGASPYPGTLVAELPGDDSTPVMPSGDKDRRYAADSPWGVFVAGLGTFDHYDSVNGNSGVQPGYSVNATGETVGADYRFNEHFAAGLAAGYVNSYADISNHGGNVYGQSARLGVYGTAYNDSFHANLYFGGAHDFFAANRNIDALGRNATASPSGNEFNMDALIGWDVKKGNALLSPFLGLAYDRTMLGSFTESGAGALDLAMAGQTAESLRSRLGVKASREFRPDWCDLTPYASIAWQHELENQSRPLTASLADGGSAPFTVNTAAVSREAALLGAGVNMDWTPGFSTRLGYQATVGFDFRSNTFDGSVRWRF